MARYCSVSRLMSTGLFLSLCVSLAILLKTSNFFVKTTLEQSQLLSRYIAYNNVPTCQDGSHSMMVGKWRTRNLTVQEEQAITYFLQSARSHHGLPVNMQRDDGLCGSVTYSGRNMHYFRALCNPKGTTPCCYNNECVSKSQSECKCSNCYDLRNEIHAEYATWEPSDARCRVNNFTAQAACGLLKGETIVVVGDSLMRHFFIALLLVLSNNAFDGALTDSAIPDVYSQCTGMNIFTEKECRSNIIRSATFCDNTVRVEFVEAFSVDNAHVFHSTFTSLIGKNRTTVLVGIGYHDSFDYTSVYQRYIRPALAERADAKSKWPHVVWSANHKFGILKTPFIPKQHNHRILEFNRNMAYYLAEYNIPIFDTYNLTSGLMSPDGSHYGIGLNVMKVQMFFNYLSQKKDIGKS